MDKMTFVAIMGSIFVIGCLAGYFYGYHVGYTTGWNAATHLHNQMVTELIKSVETIPYVGGTIARYIWENTRMVYM